MKSITHHLYRFILCLPFIIGMTSVLSAQSSITFSSDTDVAVNKEHIITLLVPGICEMCKERIESAAMDVAGVKKAEWDIKTDTLVVFGSAKMDRQKIADALAKAGYRSELAQADPKGYKKLPACCQYDSGIKKH